MSANDGVAAQWERHSGDTWSRISRASRRPWLITDASATSKATAQAVVPSGMVGVLREVNVQVNLSETAAGAYNYTFGGALLKITIGGEDKTVFRSGNQTLYPYSSSVRLGAMIESIFFLKCFIPPGGLVIQQNQKIVLSTDDSVFDAAVSTVSIYGAGELGIPMDPAEANKQENRSF